MATEIIIEDVAPQYDGAYVFDLGEQPLNTFEWGWIKKHAGYLPTDDLQFGDPEFIVTCAAICLYRDGKVEARDFPAAWETLAMAPVDGRIRLHRQPEPEMAKEDDEPVPPEESSSLKTSSSGTGSSSSSETSDETPEPSGTHDSDGPESDRLRSVS